MANSAINRPSISTLPDIPNLFGLTRKNAIINGDFQIAQRGSSWTSAATNTWLSDRWRWYHNTSAVVDITRSSDAPTVAQAGQLFTTSMKLDVTTADASMAASDYAFIAQAIEGYNWRALAQRTITVSFWIKSTKTGTSYVSMFNANDTYAVQGAFTISSADTWEKKTVTFGASPSAGTWDFSNGRGARLHFIVALGSNYTAGTADNEWHNEAYYSGPGQINMLDNTANNLFITGVQLEAGDTATEFEYRAFQDELVLCQRYYEKSAPYASLPQQANDANYLFPNMQTTLGVPNGGYYGEVLFKVPKRTVPTITTYPYTTPSNTGRSSNDVGTDYAASSAVIPNGPKEWGFDVCNQSGGALTVGSQNLIIMGWMADAEIT
jgi:hypothetical protein